MNLTGLKHIFHEPDLLTSALTHRSAGAGPGRETDNQRLEFLGDAVLDLVISDFLFRHEPRLTEGEMSRIRAGLVCEARLAEVARSLDLGQALILGPGEVQGGGRDKPSVLADAVEALLGAVYLDGGLDQARTEALDLWRPYLDRPETWADMLPDYKTRLQEETQRRSLGPPEYELLDTRGPAHARRFFIGISLRGERLAEAEAGSKKEAEQAAARAALARLKGEA
ncbi:MAG: ribonuclease III [Candidatus Adiutrix sp.]|nr:ribonuclease III [Candidatus Adiutrix sp.]